MVNKKIYLGLFVGMFLIIGFILLVIAATAPTSNSPVAHGNYSGTLFFNCTTSINTTTWRDYNVSLFYNESGGVINETVYRLVTISNTTQSQSQFNNSAVDISSLNSSRTYNFSCYADNGTDQLWTTGAYPIRINNVDLNVTSFTVSGKTNYYNYSGSNTIIYLNATIWNNLDNTNKNISSVQFKVTNRSGHLNGTYTASNWSSWYNVTLDTSDFIDEVYNITVYATDICGNVNSSEIIYSIIFDNTNPSATFSCTPASSNVGGTVTCTCTGSDNLLATTTSFTASPGTSSIGTHTQTCTVTDLVGNIGTATASYSITSGSSSSGSGTTTTWSKTMVLTSEQFKDGFTNQLQVKERIKVTVAGGTHHVGVKSLTTTSATIEIASNPVVITLSIAEDAKVDVDEDGTYDLYVKLNSIVNGKADITVKELFEAVPAGGDSVSTTGEIIEEDEGMSKTWIYIIVGIVILVAVGIGVGMKKK